MGGTLGENNWQEVGVPGVLGSSLSKCLCPSTVRDLVQMPSASFFPTVLLPERKEIPVRNCSGTAQMQHKFQKL